MKKNLTILIGALLAFALLASACGGSDSGSGSANDADQAVIDAVATQMRSDGDMPAGVDANCMAAAMVSSLGGAQVMADTYGLTAETIAAGQEPDDVVLSVDDARAMADRTMECGLADIMVSQLAGDGLSEDDASCLFEQLDQDAIRDVFASEFMNEADAARISEAAEETMFSSIFESIAECDIDPNSLG